MILRDMALAYLGFWLFLAVVVGSLIWRKTLQRREALITLRAAIERGLSLDDERLQVLLRAAGGSRRAVTHDFLLVLGALLGAGAVCAFLLALFAPNPAPRVVTPLVVIGLVIAVFAATSILLWAVFARRAKRDASPLE